MATRSTIALEYDDGSIRQIYCHWDGYLQGVGKILLEHYSSPEKVEELLNLGDMSSIASTIDDSTFYGRDYAEKFSSYEEYKNFNENLQEYNYIMRNGVWFVYINPHDSIMLNERLSDLIGGAEE